MYSDKSSHATGVVTWLFDALELTVPCKPRRVYQNTALTVLVSLLADTFTT